MKSAIFLLSFLLFCSPLEAVERLDNKAIALEVAYVALHCIDWHQTLEISDHPERYTENNPCLGKHPSNRRVNVWFGITLPLHVLAVIFLPEYRDLIQGIGIGIEGGMVMNNKNLGI